MLTSILRGAAAGAVGTTALNAVTYLDMTLRARPSSSTPERSVERLADKTGTEIPGDDEQRQNRISGLGALMGITTGLSVGIAYGAARALGWRPSSVTGTLVTALAAMTASGLPMAALGVSDPRSWSLSDWLSDLVPHLAYGLVTTATYAAFPVAAATSGRVSVLRGQAQFHDRARGEPRCY
jgi:hypothetical protein